MKSVMKVLVLLFGSGSSIIYTLLGVLTIMTSLHWKIIDPLNFTRILAVVGMIYIALQGWQVLTMKLQGIKGGVQNTILSLLPLIPILGTIFINFPQNGDNWWELILYTLTAVP